MVTPSGTDDRMGAMQRRRSTHTTHSSLATAQTSEAAVVGRTGGNYCSNPTAQSYNQGSLTHRLHAHELQRGSAASSRSGSQAEVPALPRPGWAPQLWGASKGLSSRGGAARPPPACPSPCGPYSVGSKSGFFQGKVGPVDGQSLSGLSSGVQAEPFEILHFPLCLIHIHTVQVDIFRQKDIIN